MTEPKPIYVYWYSHPNLVSADSTGNEFLDEAELRHYRSIERPEIAESFAYRRGLLRRILADHTGISAERLTFDTGVNGKPSLVGDHPELHFNTSQTGNNGLIAISSEGPVGIDVEIIRPLDAAAFSDKILSPLERIEFSALSSKDRLSTIFRYWTAKEAMIKAVGAGLNLNLLRQISVVQPNMPTEKVNWLPVKLTGLLEGRGKWYFCTESLPAPFPQPAIFSIACQKRLRLKIQQAS